VKQVAYWVETNQKKKKFEIILDPKSYCPPLVVFVSSRKGADMLAEAITKVFKCIYGRLISGL
jgi:ATP-dependent RNA helicase DDX59